MKKVVLFLSSFGFLLQVSAADPSTENVVNDEQTVEESTCGQKGDHEGFYGAVGLGVSHAKLKAKCVQHEIKSVNIPGGYRPFGPIAARAPANTDAQARYTLLNAIAGTLKVTEITSLTFNDAARVVVSGFTARGAVGKKIADGNSDSVGGWLALGYGHLLGNGYVGAEFSCDFGANRDKSADDNSLYSFYGNKAVPAKLKQTGIIPSVGVRFGFFVDQVGTLLYAKCGAAWTKLTLTSFGHSGEAKFCSPLLAVGCEKKVGLVTLRGEVEYRKGSGKNVSIYTGQAVSPVVPVAGTVFDHSIVAKVKTDAWTVRFVVTKHINSL